MHNYTTQTVTTMTSLPADDVTNSSSVWGEEDGLGDEYVSAKFIIPVIFALIFLCGVVGNGLLIAIVLRNKEMRNTPNILILSLALGDLVLITISVPFTAPIYTLPSWPFGLTICKVSVCNLPPISSELGFQWSMVKLASIDGEFKSV
jgi:hypothetical protein